MFSFQEIDLLESQRLESQHKLDSLKERDTRNKLGQFATPSGLAGEILNFAKRQFSPSEKITFLDPAFGTGAFFTALLRTFPISQILSATGFEIDPIYGDEAQKLWSNSPLSLKITDFTKLSPPSSNSNKTNLIICNPPYVRHHHLPSEDKLRLQFKVKQATGRRLNGLAGLYCYFLLLADTWLANGGLAGWLIPSEFMDVNYGEQIKSYLLHDVTLLRIHRFDPSEVQFQDAMVSSAVVWFKKEKPAANNSVEFTYGGTLQQPNVSRNISSVILDRATKWTNFPLNGSYSKDAGLAPFDKSELKLSDLFAIKRGIATGANKFFILDPERISQHKLPPECLTPILPSPRCLASDEIASDAQGLPIIDKKLFLLNCKLKEAEVEERYPSLWKYLQAGIKDGINQGYLCQHRAPWYLQETRLPAPILCTYMGRSFSKSRKPFRFILNQSKATAPNVYLMLYPQRRLSDLLNRKPELLGKIWAALNQISKETLFEEGRVYGGGLYKLEPNELANVSINEIASLLPDFRKNLLSQTSLF